MRNPQVAVDPLVPKNKVYMLNEIGRGVSSISDCGGIAGQPSAKPGNPRDSDVRSTLDLKFAMIEAHMFARLIGGLSVR